MGHGKLLVLGRQRNGPISMKLLCGGARHDQTTIWSARERRDGALDLAGVASFVDSAMFGQRANLRRNSWSIDTWPGPRHSRINSIAAHWICVGHACG